MVKAKPPDPKVDALRQYGSLNPRSDKVVDPLFVSSDFFDRRDLVQVKYEMVRRVRVDGLPVSRSVMAFGFSRPSFYQAQAALEDGGLAALVSKDDAECVMRVLPQRMAKYLLTLHPDNTRLVPFGRPRKGHLGKARARAGTFDFLGFTVGSPSTVG